MNDKDDIVFILFCILAIINNVEMRYYKNNWVDKSRLYRYHVMRKKEEKLFKWYIEPCIFDLTMNAIYRHDLNNAIFY